MAVYVDPAGYPYVHRGRKMLMCHMVADTLAELHAMAEQLGVRRYFQHQARYPHYDICKTKRGKAITLGAVEVDRRTALGYAKKLRAESLAHAATRPQEVSDV